MMQFFFHFAVQFQRRIAGRTTLRRTSGCFILGVVACLVFVGCVFSHSQEAQEKIPAAANAAQQSAAQPTSDQSKSPADQSAAPTNSQPQQSKPQDQLPNAPSNSKTEPSLEDLGFSPSQAKGDAKQQALLDKRTHMLKVHQRMGLITTGPMIATVIASFGAGGKQESRASRDLHTALGGLTGDLYFMTAYYAIRAPKIKGTETRGPIRFHKAMAWIHGPGMIATPILGIMAFDQKDKGEKVHGIAQAHGPVAIVTAGAFGAALLSVSVKF